MLNWIQIDGMQEVRGSNPRTSTKKLPNFIYCRLHLDNRAELAADGIESSWVNNDDDEY
jgi:hypothetical protein